jgi:hypothetical protein
VRCAPACRAGAEQGSAGSPQAASRDVARITAPSPWPGHEGRRSSAEHRSIWSSKERKALAMRAAPNTSLHRTPAAAPPPPLSSRALGAIAFETERTLCEA